MQVDFRSVGPSTGSVQTLVAAGDLPMLLARIHRDSEVDEQIKITAEFLGSPLVGAADTPPSLESLLEGGGFSVIQRGDGPDHQIPGDNVTTVTRLRSLPDYVDANLRVLICGLNPSLHSADLKVGFGRAGIRFWPAALASGLVTIDRDPVDALLTHRIGMTDMVKRASTKADSVTRDEYRSGLHRLDGLCSWLRPTVVCMVGLAGWRSATDRKAVAGRQQQRLGGSVVYVMPSTSGLNAHSSLADLTAHLGAATALADTELR